MIMSCAEDQANDSSGSAVRTSVGVSDEVQQTAGTELTESTICLDRQSRIDLQLRIEPLGNELGRIDGNIGPQTRRAIGIWQGKNRLPPTTYLTREQLAFLEVQTDPMMEPCVPDMRRSSPCNAAEKAGCAERPHPAVG
ncbi:peptidoglycan-binding protein [Mesorhizobium sp. M0663]|uniref:peptidoglycan-binding domain-containing protein n=1 Tax=unclassified Mesorhizobium TaxID=325217 RepID=UPI00333BD6DC